MVVVVIDVIGICVRFLLIIDIFGSWYYWHYWHWHYYCCCFCNELVVVVGAFGVVCDLFICAFGYLFFYLVDFFVLHWLLVVILVFYFFIFFFDMVL